MVLEKTEKSALQKLIEDRFEGNPPKFVSAKWDQVKLPVTQDRDHFYMQNGDAIIVQDKPHKSNRSPYCFACEETIGFVTRPYSVHFEEMPLAGGGEVRNIRIPYCSRCQEKPDTSRGYFIEE